MAYTSFSELQQRNERLFGPGCGPVQPQTHYNADDFGLKAMALRFLHVRCEGLGFSLSQKAWEAKNGAFRGTGFQPRQIPYNMQQDINRLCLARELEQFIDSGVAEDAYTVFYCFLEMFFGHYGKTKKMVELLSEFEANGSSLLMEHRDHYSHSVYVFALGLAVYESNTAFRSAFKALYRFDQDERDVDADRAAAYCFLECWGLTSLFHDIGYPFELPFEQVLSYYEVAGRKRGKGSLYLAYNNMDSAIKLHKEAQNRFYRLYKQSFSTAEELFAFGITQRLGKTYHFTQKRIYNRIHNRPIAPEAFCYYMDHAYFSAVRLYREIENSFGASRINETHVDALTAILLHNSLFKFDIVFYKENKRKAPLPMKLHPLAYLLMLCDELQCWDRTAYGRASRTELHPMAASFDFSDNAIKAIYIFDEAETEKIDAFKAEYAEWKKGPRDKDAPRLKYYSDMEGDERRFISGIEKLLDLNDIPLAIATDQASADRKNKHTYLSSSNFLHLYDFAVALNARYSYLGEEKEAVSREMEKEFEEMSLEYQLSNINQAKSFAKYLDKIRCFYTDRPVDYEMVNAFSDDQTSVFAPLEHKRWVKEHISMGWLPGDLYETAPLPPEMLQQFGNEKNARKALREQLRMHKFAMAADTTDAEIVRHHETLPDGEKQKDSEPFNSMLKLIKKFDGLRIYRLND